MTKREAIEKFVERDFNAVPRDWVETVAQASGDYPTLPMWGTMWIVDQEFIGEKLMNRSRVMVSDASDIDLDEISDETERKKVSKAIQAYETNKENWTEQTILENYTDEEMAGEHCILDKDGDTTAVFIYEIDGQYVIGIHGAGWNFYEGVWDKLYDLLDLHWHDEEAKK